MNVAKSLGNKQGGMGKKNVFVHFASALQILHQCTILSDFYAVALELRNFPLQFLSFALYSC